VRAWSGAGGAVSYRAGPVADDGGHAEVVGLVQKVVAVGCITVGSNPDLSTCATSFIRQHSASAGYTLHTPHPHTHTHSAHPTGEPLAMGLTKVRSVRLTTLWLTAAARVYARMSTSNDVSVSDCMPWLAFCSRYTRTRTHTREQAHAYIRR
jgi:hypothetical protein